jgi:S-layer protein (TIGR01567 family)
MATLIAACLVIANALFSPVLAEDGNDNNLIITGQIVAVDFTWTPQSFAGFYYDIDDNTGSEELTATLTDGELSGRYPYGLTYRTTAQEKAFAYSKWGSYLIMGFLGKKCFAGYPDSTASQENPLSALSRDGKTLPRGQLMEVLVDDDTERTFSSKNPLEFMGGYRLQIKSLDMESRKIYLELFKDDLSVDSRALLLPDKEGATSVSDLTYCYKKDVGRQKDLVVIAVHFKNAFRGSEADLATIDGLFQISERPISIQPETVFGKMTVSEVFPYGIVMDNRNSPIRLTKNKDILLAEGLHLATADQETIDEYQPLRFYPYMDTSSDQSGRYEIRGAVSSSDFDWTPENFAGFYYDPDNNVGNEILSAVISDGSLSGSPPYGLVYETRGQLKPLRFSDWGSFCVIGFLGKECFCGYADNGASGPNYLWEKSIDRDALEKGQLLEVLKDDNSEQTITQDNPLQLEEGYQLLLKNVDESGERVFVELRKNGKLMDGKQINPGKTGTLSTETYIYRQTIGSQKNVVTVAVHFKNAFLSGYGLIGTVDGIWQLSDKPIPVQEGMQFDKMTATVVDPSEMRISMANQGSAVRLSRNKQVRLMDSLGLRTADSNILKYYIFKEVVREDSPNKDNEKRKD